MNVIHIEEPKLVNGQHVYENGKYYRWYADKRICRFVDHGNGNGYMEYKTDIWAELDRRENEKRAQMQMQTPIVR